MDTITSRNPRTGEINGTVPATAPEDVRAMVDRSRKAFGDWSTLTHEERGGHLKSFKRTMLANLDRIADTVRAETGKAVEDALATDAVTAISVLDYYIRTAAKHLAPVKGSSWPYVTTRAWTEFHPRGVAGIISPWNYPFFLPAIPLVTALAAGCSVVLKPSELTPLSGQLFRDFAGEAGLPADVVQVAHGDGRVGAALVQGGVDVVAFTGSTAVGKKVAAEAAAALTPMILELGGKDAMVVLDDADPRLTARAAAWGAMLNAGQTCVGIERVYVDDAVYDEFLAELRKAVGELTAGTDDARDIGPIILPRQIEIIERHVDGARSDGAIAVTGGRRASTGAGLFYEPTILTNVDHSMEVMREETFGPVMGIVRVAGEDEALRMANDSAYGLHGSVWTRDRARGERFASRMKSGTIAVNDVAVNFAYPSVAFGGIGLSGYGANFGPGGIRSFCYSKSITSARTRIPTTRILTGGWYPRRRSPQGARRYWKRLARLLYRW